MRTKFKVFLTGTPHIKLCESGMTDGDELFSSHFNAVILIFIQELFFQSLDTQVELVLITFLLNLEPSCILSVCEMHALNFQGPLLWSANLQIEYCIHGWQSPKNSCNSTEKYPHILTTLKADCTFSVKR